jgi:hypothetical protein
VGERGGGDPRARAGVGFGSCWCAARPCAGFRLLLAVAVHRGIGAGAIGYCALVEWGKVILACHTIYLLLKWEGVPNPLL